jgi:hypothetical protein
MVLDYLRSKTGRETVPDAVMTTTRTRSRPARLRTARALRDSRTRTFARRPGASEKRARPTLVYRRLTDTLVRSRTRIETVPLQLVSPLAHAIRMTA